MEKIDLTCPKCNGLMNYDEEKSEITCPYCGHKELLEKKESIEELTKRTMNESYAREKGRQLAEEEKAKKIRKTKTIVVIFSLIFVCIISAIITKIVEPTRENIKDPFVFIDIEFSGKNGSGNAKVVLKDQSKNDIKYTISKKENLSENDIVTVNVANSSKYKFEITEKQYNVKGLAQYIKNINELNEDMRKEIHEISYSTLKSGIEGGYSFKGEITELKPYKFYLLVGNDSNILYDVYTAKIKTKSGNIYEKYVLVWYQDVIILSEDVWSYSKKEYGGKQIEAGNPREINAFSKEYAGQMKGYLSIEEFKTAVKENGGISLKLYEE